RAGRGHCRRPARQLDLQLHQPAGERVRLRLGLRPSYAPGREGNPPDQLPATQNPDALDSSLPYLDHCHTWPAVPGVVRTSSIAVYRAPTPACPTRAGSKVGLEMMPLASVTLSDGRGPEERAPTVAIQQASAACC